MPRQTTNTKESRVPCPRCRGEGNLPQFRHVEGGICFLCRGRQTVPESWLRRERVRQARVKGPRISSEARTVLATLIEQGGEVQVDAVTDVGRELIAAGLAICTARDGVRFASATLNGAKSVHKAAFAGLVDLSEDARQVLAERFGVGVQ